MRPQPNQRGKVMSNEERLKVIYGIGISEPTMFVRIDPRTGDVTPQKLDIDKELTRLESEMQPNITVEF